MPDPLLSELCTICHIHPHKYCCPRCSVRTCSLPCSKRHKQWSQCNGVRDPSVYIKRSDLATPKGIDHDYNYLTSIERQLDNAEREANGRGFLLHDQDNEKSEWRQKGLDGPRKGEVPMKAAIEKCGAIVERAPEGMARRKQNTTCWDRKRHRLIWTVEWIYDDSRREYGACSEFDPFSAAHTAHTQSTSPKEASKHGDEPLTKKKRKRRTGCSAGSAGSPVTGLSTTHDPTKRIPVDDSHTKTGFTSSQQSLNDGPKDAAPTEQCHLPSDSKPESQNTGTSLATEGASPEVIDNGISLVEPGDAGQQQSSHKHPNEPSAETIASERLVHSLHFYLHVPRLPSPRPVLIPLPPDSNLFTCLRNHLILEFPTIYALPYPTSELPDSYLTEEAFDKKMQQESFRESVLAKLTGNEEGEIEEPTKREEDMDAKKIQEVLQRDLKCLQ